MSFDGRCFGWRHLVNFKLHSVPHSALARFVFPFLRKGIVPNEPFFMLDICSTLVFDFHMSSRIHVRKTAED